MTHTLEQARIIQGDSIEFPCVHCEQPVQAGFEAIGGTAVCRVCHQKQNVPPVFCQYDEECKGFYERCGGRLSHYESEGTPGKRSCYICCDTCGAEYSQETVSEKCTRILCSKCKRPIL